MGDKAALISNLSRRQRAWACSPTRLNGPVAEASQFTVPKTVEITLWPDSTPTVVQCRVSEAVKQLQDMLQADPAHRHMVVAGKYLRVS